MQNKTSTRLLALAVVAAVNACGDSGVVAVALSGNDVVMNPPTPTAPPSTDAAPGWRSRMPNIYGGALPVASCSSASNLTGGRSYRVEIPSRKDGVPVVFQVFEPDRFDCTGRHALIFDAPGFGTARKTNENAHTGAGAGVAALTAAGFTVISIDQRGHNQSGGTARLLDPDSEGANLVQIADWAEQHLDYLAYAKGNLLLGSQGGSFGISAYQYSLYAADLDRRLDAMVPEYTWYDFGYSIYPGHTVKSYWGTVIAGGGEAATNVRIDPYLRSFVVEALATNTVPESMLAYLNYNSLSYFCGNPFGLVVGAASDSSAFTTAPLTGLLPQTADGGYVVMQAPFTTVPKVDALIFGSSRDNLYNLNESLRATQCLQRGGGDVRLLSHEFGHHAYRFATPDAPADNINAAARLPRRCGPMDANEAILAWFAEKLQGRGSVDALVTTGRDVCLSLSPGDAVRVPQLSVGGQEFTVALPGGLPAPVPIGSAQAVMVPLTTINTAGEVLGGIATAMLDVSRGDANLDALCQDETDPVLRVGTCDSTVFVGLGVLRAGAGTPMLIDQQTFPVRGIGRHEIELVGVTERLLAGDQLLLMLYGLRDDFYLSSSHDATAPIVTVSGTVRLPLLGALPRLQ